MEKYLFIAGTIALTVYAQILVKWRALEHAPPIAGQKIAYLRAMYTDPWVLSAFASALAGSVLWSLAIERMPVTLAYPFMALTFALVPVVSVMLFRETLSLTQILGIMFIVVGVGLSATTS
jgi:multidrug transporter EmrE-like cation transporter